jgi:long-chain fatty acid transport protein
MNDQGIIAARSVKRKVQWNAATIKGERIGMSVLRRTGWEIGIGAATLAGVSIAAMTAAHAGGFAVREQSAYYQGMSFAGAGTGDTLSSMYWNSAAAASAPGMNSESHVSIILPDSEITATGGLLTGEGIDPDGPGPAGPLPACAFDNCESGDIADPALVPASYANYQINDQLYLGIAMNSGFGLVTKPDNTDWAGSAIAITSDVFSINVNPTLAYKLTPELTVGVGVQVEYLDVRLNRGPFPGIETIGRTAEVDDIGFGATAGVSWTPTPGTTIGVGYRSAVKFDLEGDYASEATGGDSRSAKADLTLPDMVTIGLRQSLTDRVDLLAGYEWTNWSRAGTIPVEVTGFDGPAEELRLEYDDGHFVSLGLEYDYTPLTTLRAGVAWEKSPISDEERNVFLPDSDRLWLSVGATHRLTEKITIDLGYTHIFSDDAPICREIGGPGDPCTAPIGDEIIVAEGEASVDIIAASFKYKWGDAEPELEPLK